MFELIKKSKQSLARTGELKTIHGVIKTPFFMPVATKGAVKNLTSEEIGDLEAQIILSNTYHLYLQPGLKILKKAGGLRQLMNWSGPILTDSGGFQVFSLSKIKKIKKKGVEFKSPVDGSRHLLTPKKVLKIQSVIGSDIAMVLDICLSSKARKKEIAEAVEITTQWARKAKSKKQKMKNKQQLLFGIVQGGLYKDLRLKSLEQLVALNFDGYAVGGLAVGETASEMYQVLDYLTPQMPKNKPRYLMGVGTPENILEAVKRGIDMFDCVIPTREARHGRLYLRNKGFKYKTINITNARFKKDFNSVNQTNLKQYSRAYLHHLFKTGESLALRLATLNNLEFYLTWMKDIRIAIKQNKI